jgi:predicted dehydrogenase
MPADSQPDGILDVAVAGAGRMGSHHARIYSQIQGCRLIGVCDLHLARAQKLAKEYHCQAFSSVDELLGSGQHLHAATIAIPTISHREAAERFFARGIDILVEKPLAPNIADAQAIIAAAEKNHRVLQVGHSERFNPVVRALAGYELQPRFVEVHRISPMTFRSIDIGVVLDMMIHDIDIVNHFVRSPVKSVAAAGVAVLGEFEDVANARIMFANGCVANLTASRLALKTERKMRLFSPNAYVSVDYHKKVGVVIRKTANQEQLEMVRRKIAGGEVSDLADLNYTELVNYEQLQIQEAEPLRIEVESFLHAVRTRCKPEVTGEDGLFAVDVAARITASIAENNF